MTWIMTSDEFSTLAVTNKTGKNIGKKSIWFNGKRKDKVTGELIEQCRPQWERFIAKNFNRIVNNS